jgi:hypothetical protein
MSPGHPDGDIRFYHRCFQQKDFLFQFFRKCFMLWHVKVILFSFLQFSIFSTRVLAGNNGVIAGHGAGDLERHCMDG